MKCRDWNPKSCEAMRLALVNFVLDNNTGVSTEEWLSNHNFRCLEDLTDLEISEILLMDELKRDQV